MAAKKKAVSRYEKRVSVDGTGRSIHMDVTLPMTKEAFEIELKDEFAALRDMANEHIVVNIDEDGPREPFLQCVRFDEKSYLVEFGFKEDYFDPHPRIFRCFKDCPEKLSEVFYEALCKELDPLKVEGPWTEVTDEIFGKDKEDSKE